MRLLLIRHGQTPSNVAGALDTARPGAGLTDLGRRQAEAVPTALRDEPVRAVFASPLLRTQLTAQPLAADRGIEVQVREGLEEVSAGDLEMRTDDQAALAYFEVVAAWLEKDLDRRLAGGEDGHRFLDRYDAAVTAIAGELDGTGTGVLVSHGAAIRAFLALRGVRGLHHDDLHRLSNTGMAAIEGDPERGWTLVEYHDAPLGGRGLLDADAHDVTGETDVEHDDAP